MGMSAEKLRSSRPLRSEIKSKASRSRGKGAKPAARAATRDRLVAITATGPVYRSDLQFEVVPTRVALAFLRELASRAQNPRAEVLSTRAAVLRGDAAFTEWARVCGLIQGWLLGRTPRQRVEFLGEVMNFVGRRRDAYGVEPIVGAALNAAWPWIEPAAFERIARRASSYLRASEFAAARSMPIVDANDRTITVFAPGELARIDVDEWLDWRAMARGAANAPGAGAQGAPQRGGGFGSDIIGDLLGPGTPGGHGLDLSGLPGPDGARRGGGDNFGASIINDLLGPGTPGGHGLDLSSLPGPDGRRRNEDSYGAEIIRRLLGRGLDLSGIVGPDGQRPKQGREYGADILDQLFPQGTPGSHGLDLSNVKGNGGPYGHGAGLGPGGAAMPEAVLVGVLIGVFLVWGATLVIAHKVMDPKPAPEKPPPPEDKSPPVSSEKAPPKDDKPKPGDDKPKPKDGGGKHLYPDPDGGGGGGPAWLPDSDGSGGGNPTTLWDEFDGGGTPNTLWDEEGDGGNPAAIWDEYGGGGTPNTTADEVTRVGYTGRGILASVAQIGPSTFAL